MIDEHILQQLEDIVSNSKYLAKIPYQKGNSIRIGKYVIRKNKSGYLIYDCKTHEQKTSTWSKSAALALVKGWEESKTNEVEITRLDKIVEKNELDAMFYKNTVNKSSEASRVLSAQTRLDIANQLIYDARVKLADMIIY
tara:strand:- start:870 stop:1289 length:420 start_codon:yes stop_codon:yes gene_type:complete